MRINQSQLQDHAAVAASRQSAAIFGFQASKHGALPRRRYGVLGSLYQKVLLGILAALCGLLSPLAAADLPPASIEKVMLKEGRLLVVQAGNTRPADAEVVLPQDIRVATNASFRVKDGKPRPLSEGQVLGADGMLTSPDGSVVPVVDHVAVRSGQVTLTKDGESAAVSADVPLGDGSKITRDGYHVAAAGSRVKLLDGQMFKLDGQPIASADTVTLRGGAVRVQKDGSQFAVARGRSLMMNDGTKVFGDGYVVFRDGRTQRLSEGEILTVQGVTRTQSGSRGAGY
ncbi:MAG: hypothetical protein HZA90_03040 [Verrucomicrobia bacterium]|nr:hypothetical protein [Verrucomicrobiota bacterium]